MLCGDVVSRMQRSGGTAAEGSRAAQRTWIWLNSLRSFSGSVWMKLFDLRRRSRQP